MHDHSHRGRRCAAGNLRAATERNVVVVVLPDGEVCVKSCVRGGGFVKRAGDGAGIYRSFSAAAAARQARP